MRSSKRSVTLFVPDSRVRTLHPYRMSLYYRYSAVSRSRAIALQGATAVPPPPAVYLLASCVGLIDVAHVC